MGGCVLALISAAVLVTAAEANGTLDQSQPSFGPSFFSIGNCGSALYPRSDVHRWDQRKPRSKSMSASGVTLPTRQLRLNWGLCRAWRHTERNGTCYPRDDHRSGDVGRLQHRGLERERGCTVAGSLSSCRPQRAQAGADRWHRGARRRSRTAGSPPATRPAAARERRRTPPSTPPAPISTAAARAGPRAGPARESTQRPRARALPPPRPPPRTSPSAPSCAARTRSPPRPPARGPPSS